MNLMEWFGLTAVFAGSYLLSQGGWYLPAGLLTAVEGVFLYRTFYKRSGMVIDPAALFSVSWLGGLGLAEMKLSHLQTDWQAETWLCFYLICAAFYAAHCFSAEGLARRFGGAADTACAEQANAVPAVKNGQNLAARALSELIVMLTLISMLAFLFEAWRLSYIPLFTRNTPHAYSYFHVSGVHYFTVSCVLVPPLFILWCAYAECGNAREKAGCDPLRSAEPDRRGKGERLCLSSGAGKCRPEKRMGILRRLCSLPGVCALISLLIPILCVSRFQLLFAAILSVFVLILLLRPRLGALFSRRNLPRLLAAALVMTAAYVFLTVQRAHSVSYLNGIFEMKWERMPIFITQPYMYIAHNYDNFNCLVRELPQRAHGLRMLFPLFALTGLKFLRPELVNFPLYVTKEELTTVTLFYDAYYDFGLIGCVLFAALLGICMAVLAFLLKRAYAVSREPEAENGAEKAEQKSGADIRNPILLLVAAQLLCYISLSFFTTWFSNPATWFYLGMSAFCAVYLRLRCGRWRTEKPHAKKQQAD